LLELIRVKQAGQEDNPAQVQGVIIDVTERMEAENRVAMYANLVESVGLGMVIIGHDEDRVLRVNAANPAMRSFSTRDPEQLVDLTLADAFSELFDEGMIRSLSAVVDGGDIDTGRGRSLRPSAGLPTCRACCRYHHGRRHRVPARQRRAELPDQPRRPHRPAEPTQCGTAAERGS
jgi:PAS domain-containing protein